MFSYILIFFINLQILNIQKKNREIVGGTKTNATSNSFQHHFIVQYINSGKNQQFFMQYHTAYCATILHYVSTYSYFLHQLANTEYVFKKKNREMVGGMKTNATSNSFWPYFVVQYINSSENQHFFMHTVLLCYTIFQGNPFYNVL